MSWEVTDSHEYDGELTSLELREVGSGDPMYVHWDTDAPLTFTVKSGAVELDNLPKVIMSLMQAHGMLCNLVPEYLKETQQGTEALVDMMGQILVGTGMVKPRQDDPVVQVATESHLRKLEG